MSCHDIGRGMDSVTRVVAEMYINDEITKEVAFRLFRALRKGVNWCDGNEYEATASISGVLCGRCLKVFEDGDDVIEVWDTIADLHGKVYHSRDGGNKYVEQFEELYKAVCEKIGKDFFSRDVPDEIWNEMVSECVCKECFAEILKKCGEER